MKCINKSDRQTPGNALRNIGGLLSCHAAAARLEKGKPFTPDARQTQILTEAAVVGEAMAKANSADRRFSAAPIDFWNQLDERASWFYEAVGAGPAMAPKRPGPSSAYLGAYKDKAGEWLDGRRSYRLRVPHNPPIKLFWSVTVYDADTRALILNEQQIADRSSRMDLRKNDDGSVNIYCGPMATLLSNCRNRAITK